MGCGWTWSQGAKAFRGWSLSGSILAGRWFYAVVSFKKTFNSKVFMIKLLVSVQVAQCVGGLLWFYVMATRDWEQEGMKVRGALDHITTSVQFSSVMSDSLQPHGLQHATLPYHHQLLELTQTHIHWVDDAIQTSHPLLSPSPPAFNLSQQQSLFKWVSSSYQEAKVLEFQLQHQSIQWIFRTDFL